MTTYTIKVHNKSDQSQTFLLFNEQPAASNNISQVWSNVWVKSQGVDNPNGVATFTISSKYFAVCGESASTLASGASVSTIDSADVSITTTTDGTTSDGTKLTMNIVNDGAMFSKNVSTTSATGSFAIRTASFDATKYPNVYCGLGRTDPSDANGVVPVAIWTAKPSQDYEVQPVQKFFIATGTYSEGAIVNVADLGSTVSVDFTGTSKTKASVDLTINYTYTTPTYS